MFSYYITFSARLREPTTGLIESVISTAYITTDSKLSTKTEIERIQAGIGNQAKCDGVHYLTVNLLWWTLLENE